MTCKPYAKGLFIILLSGNSELTATERFYKQRSKLPYSQCNPKIAAEGKALHCCSRRNKKSCSSSKLFPTHTG